ncbi:hypothetical protein ACJX0J_038629, partial [Zea mays]
FMNLNEEAEINENYDHVDEYIGINEDDSMNENEEDEPDNRTHDMIRDTLHAFFLFCHFIESATWKKHIPEKILIENMSGLQKMEGTLDLLWKGYRRRESIIGTFLGIIGKTKDTINARLDLEEMSIRKHLILPVAIRGIMHRDIYEAIVELGQFFQQLCAKTLNHFYNMDGCTQMVWFQYLKIYKEELADQGTPYVQKSHDKQFSFWFKKHIAKLRYVDGEDISDDLFALSCEPDLRVRIFSACLVDGVRYHTIDREINRRTQNSGVMCEGCHGDENIEFYGRLKEIIELRYNSDMSKCRTVVLFRCDWFDTYSKKVRMKDDGYFRSINHGSCWYKDDPFILSTQATKVFYLDDTKHCESWRIVQKFTH